MANTQEMKADKTVKTLRLFAILLLVVGILALAASVYDMASGSSLLKLFDANAAEATETAIDPSHGGQTVAYVMLITAGILLVIGTIMYFVKNSYRTFQGTCIAAIIFSLFPLIFFAVSIGAHLFALVYAVLALAIIVLAILAMKSRWQVYIKEMTGEVKKLTWLTMKELVKATAVVLVFVLAFALLIYVLDLIFYTPVSLLLKGSDTPAAQEQAQPADSELTGNGAEIIIG
ncbi:MAG: preprotein translocase subunit SecE [Clostridia bacterium]|nr:preprotein translocase subunit SecE [Clostridia bacterium]